MNNTSHSKSLPVNISSFDKMSDYNMIYVDKTHLIYPLVSLPGQYFLSRPRRFGKSLLVSLLKHLFLGNRKYFEHTWIVQNKQWDFKPWPVLVFDFNEISHDNPNQFKQMISNAMDRMAKAYELKLYQTELKEKLIEFIDELHKKYNRHVIVLVDEYDKPIIDHLGGDDKRLQIALENRRILKNFFGTFKGESVASLVPFLFITGVSKFSQVSIFSELNNLTDLTMDKRFNTFLGYTSDEIRRYFHPWIEKWAMDQGITEASIYQNLKDHYDGFRFSKGPDKVYNPISILNALNIQEYKNYWFQTATPTFLINLLDNSNYSLPKIETITLIEDDFSSYEPDNLNPSALLFQTGYVTICDAQTNNNETKYRFDFPNIEVKKSFLKLLMIKYGRLSKDDNLSDHFKIYQDFIHKRFELAIQTIQDVFQRIPKFDHQTNDWFHQFFYMIIRSACPFTRTLNISDKMVIMIESEQSIILTAFSCIHSGAELITCLNHEQNINNLINSDKEIFIIGMNFNIQKRMIEDWTYEHINPEPVEIPEKQKSSVKIIKLFLASSSDLANERSGIGLWINRKNKLLLKNNLFIDLVVWEDLLHSFQGQRIQDYFNKEMLACDIVVALFYSKVGAFTKEEFELAYENLKIGKKPHYLFVGFKDAQISTSDITKEYLEILQLREKIQQNEQLYLSFDSMDQLILKLNDQLEKVIEII
ncbi:ATPase AAA [Candidatus Magnetomorum sp. HK-1]|nr:ATPase AAA [Candidatus Magnetomorum sp. HK-1]